MKALRNIWYMAAWSEEVEQGKLFHRQIIGEHIVFFRDDAEQVRAIGDRCPHRFAPLHMGQQVGSPGTELEFAL